MNKKLLLSFAVFATALSVNAQKRSVKVPKANVKEVVAVSNNSTSEESLKKTKNASSKKRGDVTVTDTLRLPALKQTYGCPNHAFFTRRPILSKVYSFNGDAYHVGVAQTYNSAVPTNIKGVGVKLVTYNAKDVDFLVAYTKLNGNDTVVKITKSLPKITSAADYFVDFPEAIASKDTFTITVKPNSATDSILVYTTGIYNQKATAFGKISNDTLTVDQTKITNGNFDQVGFYKGWLFDDQGFPYGGGFAANFTVLSGKNILPGTKILSQIGQYQYRIDKPQTVALDTIFGEVAQLDENETYGFQSVLKVPASGPSELLGASLWDNGQVGYFSDAYIYPIVEYKLESSAVATDVCLGGDKTVKVDFDANKLNAIVKSSVFNKNAFYAKFLNFGKKEASFANLYAASDYNYSDTMDINGENFTKVYADDSKNDTLIAVEYILGYGYKVALGYKEAVSYFTVSSKINAEGSALSVAHLNLTDGKVAVSANGGYAPYTYSWTGSSETNDTIMVAVGEYTATATDANGCTASTSALKVELSSVAELGLTNVAVYPNPANNFVNVKFDAKSAATVELVNVAGQVLDSKNANNVVFNTANLVAGVYFVNIKVAEGVYTHKIIKE